jgi:hypothetical protein
MAFLAVPLFLLCTTIMSVFAESDTTYGPTHAVPSEKEENERVDPLPSTTTPLDESADDGCASSCLSAAFEPIVSLLVDGFWESNKSLFVGNASVDRWYNRSFFTALSFTLGGVYYPENGGGLSGSLSADVLWHPFSQVHLRERIGINSGMLFSSPDYQRAVFVNGNRIGMQYDEIANNVSFRQYQFLTDCMITPAAHGSLYFAFGGGTVYQVEKTHLYRSNDFSSDIATVPERDESWCPAIAFSIGRITAFKKLFGTYEIGYQGVFTSFDHDKSLPGNNARMSHSIGLKWSLVF